MSGRPVRRRVLLAVQRAGGWPAVLDRIADGETVTMIARGFDVSRSFFARLLHEDRDRHELVRRAREEAADALIDEALEIADSATATPDGLDRARLRIRSRLWEAARLGPARYGRAARARAQLSAGPAHLAALRAQAATQDWKLAAPSVGVDTRVADHSPSRTRRSAEDP